MKIYKSVNEIVGHTPLVELTNIEKNENLKARVLVKLEMLNPGGSIKDRTALNLINEAEKRGLLKPGSTIIEPTSGNTGIGLVVMAKKAGYRVILTMPETMSVERRNLLKAYGAELVLTDGTKGMKGAIEMAEKLASEIEGSFIPGQFTNKANSEAHYLSTGPEIWEDTEGNIDIFVAGAGTGGTVTGTGKYLKEKNNEIKVYAVEPFSSAVISGEKAGKHNLQGIGAGFIPEVLDVKILNKVIKVKDEEAYEYGRKLAKMEGILAGITSGANVFASCCLAKLPENEGKTIVTILPDTGDHYFSTELFKF